MTSAAPLVSVVMPVYNAMPYLVEAVASVLGQTLRDIEVLALDDASTDGSAEYLDSIRDARLKVIHCPKQGYTPLLNMGLQLAAAPYVARMDADDISLPQRIKKQVAFMERNPQVVACGAQVIRIGLGGGELGLMEYPRTHASLLVRLSAGHCPFAHPVVLMRTDALRETGGYDPTREPAEDLDLWWRLCWRGGLANLDEVLLKYRWHGANVSVLRAEEQQRATLDISVDYLVARGIASSSEEARAYLAFLRDGKDARLPISETQIRAFAVVSQRLLNTVKSCAFSGWAYSCDIQRPLRWALLAQARSCSWASFTRYRLLLLSSRLFPQEGSVRAVITRKLRRAAGRLTRGAGLLRKLVPSRNREV